GGLLVETDEREVDERQLVAGGKHPRDALARRDALLDEGRGERARLLGTAAGERELVLGDELRGCEEVDDELDRLADHERRGQRRARLSRLRADGTKRRNGLLLVAQRLGEVADVTFDPS